MLECYVSGQSLKLYTPVIAADSLHYLTGLVHFSGGDWDGHSAWLHFRKGETVYDVALDEDGAFDEEAELTLTAGEWELYLTGSDGEDRITTVPVLLTVKASGLVDSPLHPVPLSVAEQIDSKATTALAFAAAVKAAAEAGDFDGEDGKSFVIGGFYDTCAELTAAVADPAPGEAYGVGTTIPYDIYIWDEINLVWKNNGPIQGARGETGAAGATFTPSVDASGNLSWTNNGGLDNPTARNIKGPTGETGPAGADGASPYETAVENGYTGTEATFNAALAAVPYHNARHLPTGADPISVQTDNLANAAVTAAKIAAGAVSTEYGATLTALGWTGTEAPYSQAVTVSGVLASDKPFVEVAMSGTFSADEARDEEWGSIYRAVPGADTLTVYAREKPTVDLPIRIFCVRK